MFLSLDDGAEYEIDIQNEKAYNIFLRGKVPHPGDHIVLVRKDNAVDGQTSTPGGTKPDCSAADREHANDNDPTKQPTSAMEGPEAVLDDSQTDYGGMIYRRCKSGAPGDGKSTTWPAEAAKCDGVVKACASTCDPSTCQVWKDCDPNEDDSTKAKFCTPGESDFYHPDCQFKTQVNMKGKW